MCVHNYYSYIKLLISMQNSYVAYPPYKLMYMSKYLLASCIRILIASRLMIVTRKAKKKQAVCNKRVSYLHVALL